MEKVWEKQVERFLHQIAEEESGGEADVNEKQDVEKVWKGAAGRADTETDEEVSLKELKKNRKLKKKKT